MKSEFATIMDRHRLDDRDAFIPDEKSPSERMLADRGVEHETRILTEMESRGQKVVRIQADSDVEQDLLTREALESDADVIFQARLSHGQFAGFADFLRRGADNRWEVWDSKLARSAKSEHLIQLCCYAEMLEGMTGSLPERIGIILGNSIHQEFSTHDFLYYYREIKASFLDCMASFDPGKLPEPTGFGSNGRWQARAEKWLTENDHLSLVANIRSTQVKRLYNAGISTVTNLAHTELLRVDGIGDEVFQRLRKQARLQIETGASHEPRFELNDLAHTTGRQGLQLLPPPSDLDVYFDMEGYPLMEGGLEYLFGATFVEEGTLEFRDWWACDKSEEVNAFENFIDWVYERWNRDPSMHIYHYGHYEQSALKRLMGAYASRENQIDNLLRGNVFVDLYQVISQGLCIGTPSYSIKYVERLYRPLREGDVDTAVDSIVAFDAWLQSGESSDWQESTLLRGIREYNKDDCDSTLELAHWLRDRQSEFDIEWVSPDSDPELTADTGPRSDAERLSIEMLESMSDKGEEPSPEDSITRMLAWLLEYHRREDKPSWWKYFNREGQTTEELFEDIECLAGLQRTERPPEVIKRSLSYEYHFDPNQESKVSAEGRYYLAQDLKTGVIVESMNHDEGLISLKIGASRGPLPDTLDLVPGGPIANAVKRDSLLRTALQWKSEGQLQSCVRHFLERREPTIRDRLFGTPVLTEGESLEQGTVRAVLNLDDSILCIQGPPGTGKTHVAARSILALLAQGKRVGVTGNSHKVIVNLLSKVSELAAETAQNFHGIKIGDNNEFEKDTRIDWVKDSNSWTPGATGGQRLAGATSWAFSRSDWAGCFDYLFVDEAGQVSMADLVAMAPSTRNLVIIGDQMQLEQPVQGAHPGNSAQSVMAYFMAEHATIPPEKGILLNESWRLHPGICTFISDAVYDSRLTSKPHCINCVVKNNGLNSEVLTVESGTVYIPSVHTGNSQSSEEEADVIQILVQELVGRSITGVDGAEQRKLELNDILFVAPYNMQVNLLKSRLGTTARVASVDKFQGQEAPVVILSMCASSADDVPRGMDFLLSINRLNVAISRAQSLAIVVGSPLLRRPTCTTIDQMKLANFFGRFIAYAEAE
ncbi:MAG: TM0106 family RecB-like putative nuclease [Rhodothermales bacterium]